MEIWKQSNKLESTGRHLSSQTQSRIQISEIAYQLDAAMNCVDFGEMLITVLKGNGIIKTNTSSDELEKGDQVYLNQGDFFLLSAITDETKFIVQMYWAPQINLDM